MKYLILAREKVNISGYWKGLGEYCRLVEQPYIYWEGDSEDEGLKQLQYFAEKDQTKYYFLMTLFAQAEIKTEVSVKRRY